MGPGRSVIVVQSTTTPRRRERREGGPRRPPTLLLRTAFVLAAVLASALGAAPESHAQWRRSKGAGAFAPPRLRGNVGRRRRAHRRPVHPVGRRKLIRPPAQPSPPVLTRLAVIVTLLALMFPANGIATTLISKDGTIRPQPYQSWVDQANVPTPAGRIRLDLTANACGGYICAFPRQSRIVMFSGLIDNYTRPELLHEIGHIYSFRHQELHRLFLRIFGAPRWTWLTEEWFAQGYSWCATRFRALPGYDYWPTRKQHRDVCSLLRQPR